VTAPEPLRAEPAIEGLTSGAEAEDLGGLLLERTARLVGVASVSHQEAELADLVEAELRDVADLSVERIGDSVVARSADRGGARLVLAGHLDTVPPAVEGLGIERLPDAVAGLGAVDMKGGLAVLLELAFRAAHARVGLTFVFYACEEVAREENALGRLAQERPDLLEGDAAVLAEPTGGVVEAGCQGTARIRVTLGGRRAHTARPWTGVNAVHRMAPLLARISGYPGRRVRLDGCEYREQLQAVAVQGGTAANVVPDLAQLVLNHRFAPDRSPEEALAALEAWVKEDLQTALGDQLEVLDVAPAAPPHLASPWLAALVAATGQAPRAKLGWTDVATFAGMGVPAANFGPGDPRLAHGPREVVHRDELLHAFWVLGALVGLPTSGPELDPRGPEEPVPPRS
jgi:succinyl-diaminopimelate desuccinylase